MGLQSRFSQVRNHKKSLYKEEEREGGTEYQEEGRKETEGEEERKEGRKEK